VNDINDETRDQLEQDIHEADLAPEGDENAVVDALIAERDQWKDRALRAVADAENTKRRAETQQNDARAYAIQRFAKDLLGVADTLERGLATAPKDADGPTAAMVTGLELTQKSLLSAFEANGLTRVARRRATPSTRTCIRR
jgi:molecular chaperone GrpE